MAPTGTFTRCQSGYGLFDMSGNAAEWTSGRYQAGMADRVIKGGSVDRPDYDLRCSSRQNRSPQNRSPLGGVQVQVGFSHFFASAIVLLRIGPNKSLPD